MCCTRWLWGMGARETLVHWARAGCGKGSNAGGNVLGWWDTEALGANARGGCRPAYTSPYSTDRFGRALSVGVRVTGQFEWGLVSLWDAMESRQPPRYTERDPPGFAFGWSVRLPARGAAGSLAAEVAASPRSGTKPGASWHTAATNSGPGLWQTERGGGKMEEQQVHRGVCAAGEPTAVTRVPPRVPRE